jgi:magnesium-transporting ATPase (P-type)
VSGSASIAAPPAEPWARSGADVAAELDTDPATGLTNAEAAARVERFGPNRLDPEPPVPAWRKLLRQFADPLVYLLLIAIGISVVTWAIDGANGVPFEAITIGAILLANAVLGYVQEASAEQAVAALQRMAAPTSTVVREGVPLRVPTDEIVPGDALVLAEGDAVGADARLIDAASLTVAEAALTGESEPVLKDQATLPSQVALGDRLNMVFSGTAVTRGRGRAVVTATGMSTEVGGIARLLGETKEERTPLQREIDHLGRRLGIAVLIIAAVVIATILLMSRIDELSDVVDILLVGVSLAVAAIPEGLPAVLSVVLALGVQRMARQSAIVKQLSSVETLGSASVISSDKTGTLTRNEMTIQRIVTASGEVTVTGVGYRPDGEFVTDGKSLEDGPLLEEARAVVNLGSLAGDASVREEAGEWIVNGDPTEGAFLVARQKAGTVVDLERRFHRVGEVPFTSERKLMTTLQEDAERDGGLVIATKGAPDVLLTRCTHERVGGEPRPLDDERRRQILATVDSLAGQAFRTLGAAYRRLPTVVPDEPEELSEDLEHELVFAGVVGIIDPPRAEARVAIDEAHRAGIRVLMITGDHPRTAARIAEDLDMVRAGARTVTGTEIEELNDVTFREAIDEASVYARVAPEHKLRIVDALQAEGQIVAMTGDGVNDAPALKRADIGIAMGITGTDVAKQAANMILVDDNFATIVAAVREGRGIFANIRKVLRYLLSSNVGEVLTMFFGVVGAGVIGLDAAGGAAAVPLLATQILWINLLTDSAPALAMGMDPPPDDVMSSPPRRLNDRIIDAPMQRTILFIGIVMAATTLLALDIGLPGGIVEGSGSLRHARTLAFTTLVLAQLFNCFNARSERVSAFHHLFTNPLLWVAIGVSVLLQAVVVYVPFLQDPFGTTALSAVDWLLCAGMASTVLWADELRKLAVGRSTRRRMPG